jgi:glycosyltransferase involved in cell wall biosynthesis
VRLIHLADYGGSHSGSLVPMLRAACTAGQREGWEVELLLSDIARGRSWLPALEDAGIPVHFAPVDTRANAQAAIAAHLERIKGPVILHSHFSSFDVPMVRAAAGRPQTGLWWHLHSYLSREPVVRLRNTARFLVYGRRVHEILCVAPHLVREARDRLAPPGRLHHFPNAINTSRFPLVTPQERAAARQELGLRPDARVVLHLSWDWHLKGGDIFLGAVARLAERDNLTFLTLGGGDIAAVAVAAAGLSDRVRVLDPVDDARGLYAAADVLVSPSRDEGMPFSMIEALSRGIGVVASAIPGQLYVGRDLGAVRFTPLDAGALAAGVADLLARDAATVEADADAAHRRIAGSMDLEDWSRRLIDRYRRRAQVLSPDDRSPS